MPSLDLFCRCDLIIKIENEKQTVKTKCWPCYRPVNVRHTDLALLNPFAHPIEELLLSARNQHRTKTESLQRRNGEVVFELRIKSTPTLGRMEDRRSAPSKPR